MAFLIEQNASCLHSSEIVPTGEHLDEALPNTLYSAGATLQDALRLHKEAGKRERCILIGPPTLTFYVSDSPLSRLMDSLEKKYDPYLNHPIISRFPRPTLSQSLWNGLKRFAADWHDANFGR